MRYILILTLLLGLSCGKKGENLNVTADGPDHWLVFDPFCAYRISRPKLKRAMTGTRKFSIPTKDIKCRPLNVTKRQYLGEEYGFDEAFEDGQWVYMLDDQSLENLYKFMLAHGMMVED